MNIFELHERLIGDYASSIKSFIKIRNSRSSYYAQQKLEECVLWPEPREKAYIQI